MDEYYSKGEQVVMISAEAHEKHPVYYPKVGTIGVIIGEYYESERIIFAVQWPEGTTSGSDQWLARGDYLAPYYGVQYSVDQGSNDMIDSYFNEFEEV